MGFLWAAEALEGHKLSCQGRFDAQKALKTHFDRFEMRKYFGAERKFEMEGRRYSVTSLGKLDI